MTIANAAGVAVHDAPSGLRDEVGQAAAAGQAAVEPGGSVPDVVRKLEPWPSVFEALRSDERIVRKVARARTGEEAENQIGTRLMAHFRDTRSVEAFEALYAFARPAVLRWIRSLTRKGLAHLDPAELLQDTFVNVYRYPGSFREEHAGSFRVWVRTIAGNIVRRASTRSSSVSFQELPDGLREPADSRENPEQVAVSDEQSEHLKRAWMLFLCHYASAWEQLAPRDRRALELVEVDGNTYEEAGRILEVRRSNMKMIIFRSRKRIASRMRAAMRPATAGCTGRIRMAG